MIRLCFHPVSQRILHSTQLLLFHRAGLSKTLQFDGFSYFIPFFSFFPGLEVLEHVASDENFPRDTRAAPPCVPGAIGPFT